MNLDLYRKSSLKPKKLSEDKVMKNFKETITAIYNDCRSWRNHVFKTCRDAAYGYESCLNVQTHMRNAVRLTDRKLAKYGFSSLDDLVNKDSSLVQMIDIITSEITDNIAAMEAAQNELKKFHSLINRQLIEIYRSLGFNPRSGGTLHALYGAKYDCIRIDVVDYAKSICITSNLHCLDSDLWVDSKTYQIDYTIGLDLRMYEEIRTDLAQLLQEYMKLNHNV